MEKVLRKLRNRKLVDAVVLVSALWLAYLLRFDFMISSDVARSAMIITPFVVLLQVSVLHHRGIHRVVGRYVSFDDLGDYAWAAVAWLVPMLGVRVLLPAGPWRIPLSVSLMDTLLVVVGLLAVRLAQRVNAERWHVEPPQPNEAKPVLLVGAGEAGVDVAREIRRHQTNLRVVGYVDDDPAKHGGVIAGSEVLGASEEIPRLVREYGIDHVIITIVDAPPHVMQRIVRICGTVPIRVRTIPSFLEIVQGSVEITRFKDVDLEDLLGRDPIQLDLSSDVAAYLADKRVIVTGAGGSIGSELARQVAAFGPEVLLLVEQFEGALFEIHKELLEEFPELRLLPLVADITDRPRMQRIFDYYRPDVVVHAAAHKHVAMMEENAGEAIKNNAFGTRILAEIAGQAGVACFVHVSTDKAVRPTCIMGASKRLAEMVVQQCTGVYRDTKYVAVRFGNVMGSSGSVIPIFKDQVRKGGPVTVTHEQATRYFMTIPEASRLVLTAGAIGLGGEIMVLDMGQPVRIIDLARNLIRLSGFVPDEEIPIEITGLTPGEKLSEELYVDGEEMELTRHAKIFVGKANGCEGIDDVLNQLAVMVDDGDEALLRRIVHSAIHDSRLLPPDVPSSTSEGIGVAG